VNAPSPPTLDQVRDALARVVDPEMGLDIVTLGLVYDLRVEDGVVAVTYTLTTRGCPLAGVLERAITATLYALSGVERVDTHLVWEPRWSPDRIDRNAWSET